MRRLGVRITDDYTWQVTKNGDAMIVLLGIQFTLAEPSPWFRVLCASSEAPPVKANSASPRGPRRSARSFVN